MADLTTRTIITCYAIMQVANDTLLTEREFEFKFASEHGEVAIHSKNVDEFRIGSSYEIAITPVN